MSEKENFVPQILGNCYQNNLTGTLSLNNEDCSKIIHFREGYIVFADSTLPNEQWTEKLLDWGCFIQAEIEQAEQLAIQHEISLPQALIDLQFVAAEELYPFFKRLIADIVRETLCWRNFEHSVAICPLPEYTLPISISTLQIIINGLREAPNLPLIRRMLGDFNTIFQPIGDFSANYPELVLEPEERFLISFLATEAYSINQLIKLSDVPKVTVIRILCALFYAGVLKTDQEVVLSPAPELAPLPELTATDEVAPEVAAEMVPEPVPEVTPSPSQNALTTEVAMQLCYQVEDKLAEINNGANFYKILEIDSDSVPEQISTAYQELSQRFSLEQQQLLTAYNLDLSQQLRSISATLKQAYATLVEPQARTKYNESIGIKRKLAAKVTSSNVLDNSQQQVMDLCVQIENKHSMLKRGANHYQVLDLDINADRDAINGAYRQLAERFSLKKQELLSAHNINMKAQLEDIARALREAINTLTDNVEKPKYDRQIAPSSRNTGQIARPSQLSPTPIPAKSPSYIPNQQELMELCYLIEGKLNRIKQGASHYQTLELELTASRETIQAAYNHLAEQFSLKKHAQLAAHGINMKGQLEEITKALSEALTVLTNPTQKQRYDEQMAKSLRRDTSKITRPVTLPNMPAIPSTPQSTPQNIPPYHTPKIAPITGAYRAIPTQPPLASANSVSSPKPLSSAPTPLPSGSLPPLSKDGANVNSNKPSIVIDPLSMARPSFTPVSASKAYIPTPTPLAPPPVVEAPKPAAKAAATNSQPEAIGESLPTSKKTPGNKSKAMSSAEYYMQSIELCDKKQYKEALALIRKALDVSPKDSEYWAQMGRIQNRLKNLKETEAAYKKAIANDGENIDYLLELGTIYRDNELYDQAFQMFDEALQINPNSRRAKMAIDEMAKKGQGNSEDNSAGNKFWSKLNFWRN